MNEPPTTEEQEAWAIQNWGRQTIAFSISIRNFNEALAEPQQAALANEEMERVTRSLWQDATAAASTRNETMRTFPRLVIQWAADRIGQSSRRP